MRIPNGKITHRRRVIAVVLLIKTSTKGVRMMAQPRDVFVIMPFSATSGCTEAEWTEVFEQVFRPAIEACGYSCERAAPKTGSLIASIVERLKTARIVLADITDRNPNVFYELGVRHSLSKRTIIVCRTASDIPSDLRGYWSLEYGIRPAQVAKFRSDIGRIISEIERQPEKSDSPVSDYLERENLSVSAYAHAENVKKLGALYTELSGNLLFLGARLAEAQDDQHEGFFSTACLQLLLQTMYVDIGPDLLKLAYELLHDMRRIAAGNGDKTLIRSALGGTDRLSQEVFRLRTRLMSGDYEEPPVVSTMAWAPSDDSVSGKMCWHVYESELSEIRACRNCLVEEAMKAGTPDAPSGRHFISRPVSDLDQAPSPDDERNGVPQASEHEDCG